MCLWPGAGIFILRKKSLLSIPIKWLLSCCGVVLWCGAGGLQESLILQVVFRQAWPVPEFSMVLLITDLSVLCHSSDLSTNICILTIISIIDELLAWHQSSIDKQSEIISEECDETVSCPLANTASDTDQFTAATNIFSKLFLTEFKRVENTGDHGAGCSGVSRQAE